MALECGVANYPQIPEGTANGTAAGAGVQADGATRSVLPPAALGAVAARMPLLGRLFDVQQALSVSGIKPAHDSGPLCPWRKEKVMRHTCSDTPFVGFTFFISQLADDPPIGHLASSTLVQQ